MLDPSDCSLSLDNLFFEKPIVHKVKPLHQETSPWHLDVPPSLSQIPATHDKQEEAESLPTRYNFSVKRVPASRSLPPFKLSAGLKVLSQINSCYGFNHDEKEFEDTQCGSNSNSISKCDGLWGGEGFRDYSQGACQSGRGGDETPQDSGHVAVSRRLPWRQYLLLFSRHGDSCKQLSPFPPKPPLSPPSWLNCKQVADTAGHTLRDAGQGHKESLVPPMTPQPLCIQVLQSLNNANTASKFRSVFSEFPFFNYVQSKALDDVLYTGRNFVACAPTGSGKTVLFELAIIRMLMETSEPWRDVKAVYRKMGQHDKKWKDNCLLQLVRLLLIDEVHVVKDKTRGATLEVVVSRMKAVNTYRTAQNPESGLSIRFMAVSATIPNISDIADWLSNESGPATYLEMDESHRPVKLRKFALTRKGAQQSAAVLAKDARFIMSIEHKQRLLQYANSILDSKLRELVMFGVGFHHAGVEMSDRKLIEEAFTLGDLPVL
ncbi:unnamed protein product, partial [Pleuronectes platessa]